VLLNASGCLDALAAPAVANALDAFVTKTITPLPREGNPPVRIAETDVGMLNSIGLANPGRYAFLADTLPRLRELLRVPIWVSVGGFSAGDYAETCALLDDVAAVELPERGRGAGVGGGDRRGVSRRDRAAAVREAVGCSSGHRGGCGRRA
jgi:dihydroorotate dehydrogenase